MRVRIKAGGESGAILPIEDRQFRAELKDLKALVLLMVEQAKSSGKEVEFTVGRQKFLLYPTGNRGHKEAVKVVKGFTTINW